MEWFRLLFDHLAWIEHQFLSGIRDSRKAGSLWGMMRAVGGVRKSIHHSWFTKGLALRLLCWSFKGVQEEIPWEVTTIHQSTTPSLSQTIWPRWASSEFLTLLAPYLWVGWLVGCVLWHINQYGLFNAKSSLHIYIKYIWFVNTFYTEHT